MDRATAARQLESLLQTAVDEERATLTCETTGSNIDSCDCRPCIWNRRLRNGHQYGSED